MIRDLGKVGEHTLGKWTAEVGIISNKSTENDATGWDFILEWPLSLDPETFTLPLDKIPAPMKCLVQVKTTGASIFRWQVPLSNWFHLIRNPWPTFFLVLKFDEENNCKKAYLIHVGKDYISNVLKNLRLATKGVKTAKKRKAKLNKIQMQFSWSDIDLLSSSDGNGLEAAIMSHIANGFDEYIRWKQELCKNLGYEAGGGKFNFTVLMPKHIDIEQHFVDFDIGLVPEIEIQEGEQIDDRFGVPILVDTLKAGTKFQVIPEPEKTKGQVVIVGPKHGKIFLDCDVYLPKSFGRFVSKDKLRARFDAGDWMFLVPFGGAKKFNMSFNLPDLKKKLPIWKLYNSARVILAIQSSMDCQSPMRLSVSYGNDHLGQGSIDLSHRISPSLIEWAKMVESAWIVARHFSIEGNVETSGEALAWQNLGLILSRAFLSPEPSRFKVSFWLDVPSPKTESIWCAPFPAQLRLGDYRIQMATGLLGRISFTGNEQGVARQYELLVNSVCSCFEQILGAADGPEKSYEELRTYVSEHHKADMEIVYLESSNEDSPKSLMPPVKPDLDVN